LSSDFQLFEQKTTAPTQSYYTINRVYERTVGFGVKLQFNRGNHGLTTINKPWSSITKYEFNDNGSIGTVSNNSGVIIFDFNKYMAITSFDIYHYHFNAGSMHINLYYWDDSTNSWIQIFDGTSTNANQSFDNIMLYFRKDNINSGSGVSVVRSPPSGVPIIRLHYIKGSNAINSGVVDDFVRQEKWAYKFKLELSNNGSLSDHVRGM
jgi:hypothetical protein